MKKELVKLKKFLDKKGFEKESRQLNNLIYKKAYIGEGFVKLYDDAISFLQSTGLVDEPEKLPKITAQLVNLNEFEDDFQNSITFSDEERASIMNSISGGKPYKTDRTIKGKVFRNFIEKECNISNVDFSVIITDHTFKPEDVDCSYLSAPYYIYLDEGIVIHDAYIVISNETSHASEELNKELEALQKEIEVLKKQKEEFEKANKKGTYEVIFEEEKPEEKKDDVFYYTKRARCGNDVCYIKEDGTSHKVLDIEKQYPKEKIIKK
jgi:hypothetical protein